MKKKSKTRIVEQPYAAIVKFLEKNGWSVYVLGGAAIRQRGLKLNYTLEFNFTGSKRGSRDE